MPCLIEGHGLVSILLTLAAAGVVASGIGTCSPRPATSGLATRPAAELVSALTGRRAILVTGGTGFIGSRLIAAFPPSRPGTT